MQKQKNKKGKNKKDEALEELEKYLENLKKLEEEEKQKEKRKFRLFFNKKHYQLFKRKILEEGFKPCSLGDGCCYIEGPKDKIRKLFVERMKFNPDALENRLKFDKLRLKKYGIE